MPRIQPAQLDQTDVATRTTLEAVQSKIGMIPNLYATFARSPAALTAYLALNDALASGRLTGAEREVIALAVGQANACQYCLSAHTLLGRGAGLSPQEMERARRADGSNGLASLAASIVEQRGMLSDAQLESARALGLDDETIVEVIANVALNILTNYTNHIAGTDIDFPAVDIQL